MQAETAKKIEYNLLCRCVCLTDMLNAYLFDRIDYHRIVTIQRTFDFVTVVAILRGAIRAIFAYTFAKSGNIIFIPVALCCENGFHDPLIVRFDRAFLSCTNAAITLSICINAMGADSLFDCFKILIHEIHLL